MNNYLISGSPHVHGNESTKKIMYSVIIALMPAFLFSIYYFGFSAVRVTLIAVAACVLTEWLIQKFLIKGPCTIGDGSAIITGMLLAFNLPSNIPAWMIIVGSIVAIGIGKMSFGGLGNNPFNPALVGRVFMLISFPVAMTTWPAPQPLFGSQIDGFTGATLLGYVKEGLAKGVSANELTVYENIEPLIYSGSLGEIGSIAIIIGGLFLIFRKVIDWQTPVIIIATAGIIATVCWLIDPTQFVHPMIHIFGGGMMLGAFFMATDMATSPMTIKGKIIFAIGIGALTIIIRLWGAYPEGMSFAILIMNAFVPLINKMCKPTRFGNKPVKQ
ncbi:MAG: RnfABCDGE type electron transport complex subunit D [Bacteroidales bacterium]|nr:RnfABCDGE type electron transport complex subunit D [Bacteroidales bacterium]MBR7176544.1 RnfABCDGE type electron transport complex subunit D [Bacteroidales bacterium]